MGKDKVGASAAFWLVMILLLLILPLWFLKGDTGSSSFDPALQELVVKPRPAAGGSEATLSRTLVSGKWHADTTMPDRLQAMRNVCASLPELEDGPIGRMTAEDAEAVADLLAGLPFEDVSTRIEWAKPYVGDSTHMQESLISGGQNFGLFECTDEITAATVWALAPTRGWSVGLQRCALRGGSCQGQLLRRFSYCKERIDECARHMKFKELTELRLLLGMAPGGPPASDEARQILGDYSVKQTLEEIERAKLAQNPG